MQITSIENLISKKRNSLFGFQKQTSLIMAPLKPSQGLTAHPTTLGFSSSLMTSKAEVMEVCEYVRAPISRFRAVYLDFDLDGGLRTTPIQVKKVHRPSIDFSVMGRSKMVNMNDLLSGTSSSVSSNSKFQEEESFGDESSDDEDSEIGGSQSCSLVEGYQEYNHPLIESIMASSSSSSSSKGDLEQEEQEKDEIPASLGLTDCSRRLNIIQGTSSECGSLNRNNSPPKNHRKQYPQGIQFGYLNKASQKDRTFKLFGVNQIKFIKKSKSLDTKKINSGNFDAIRLQINSRNFNRKRSLIIQDIKKNVHTTLSNYQTSCLVGDVSEGKCGICDKNLPTQEINLHASLKYDVCEHYVHQKCMEDKIGMHGSQLFCPVCAKQQIAFENL